MASRTSLVLVLPALLLVGLLASTEATTCPSGFQIRGVCVPLGVSPLHFYVHSVHDDDLPEPFVTQRFKSAGGCDLTVYNFLVVWRFFGGLANACVS